MKEKLTEEIIKAAWDLSEQSGLSEADKNDARLEAMLRGTAAGLAWMVSLKTPNVSLEYAKELREQFYNAMRAKAVSLIAPFGYDDTEERNR